MTSSIRSGPSDVAGDDYGQAEGLDAFSLVKQHEGRCDLILFDARRAG
jgi:hypothetical protein